MNDVTSLPVSPYREALTWIKRHPGTGSSHTLTKLLLTLRRGGFSIDECVKELDDTRLELALRIINHFAVFPDYKELSEIERYLESREPRMVAVFQSVELARDTLWERWRKEDR